MICEMHVCYPLQLQFYDSLCGHGLRWGVEVLLHRYFASSACRSLDPDEANLFLVPDYRACHLHLAAQPW